MSKEHKGSKTLDQEKLNDPELVSSVAERLTNLDGLAGNKKVEDDPTDLDDDTDDSTLEKDDSQADDSESDDDSTSDADKDGADEDDEKDANKDDAGTETKAILPDAFRRAAVHQGWEDKDVDEFFKADPKAALRTFENIYNSTNNLSKKYGELGRAHRQAEAAKTAKDAEDKKVEFTGVDIAKLEEMVDLDPAVKAILVAQNKQLEAITKTVNEFSTTHKPVEDINREATRHKVAADATVEQQIRNFFETDTMTPYKKFYGDLDLSMSWEDLTAGQRENRYRVIEQADLMMAGAAMQGQEMKVNEALELAHLLVTEPVRERIIREQIKGQVQKRNKSMVLKPSGKKIESNVSSGLDGKPQTRKELLERTEQRLANTFKR